MASCANQLQLPTASLHALRRQAGRVVIPPPRPRRRPRSAIVAAMDAGGPGPVVVRRLLPLLLPTGLDPSPPPSWSELLLPSRSVTRRSSGAAPSTWTTWPRWRPSPTPTTRSAASSSRSRAAATRATRSPQLRDSASAPGSFPRCVLDFPLPPLHFPLTGHK